MTTITKIQSTAEPVQSEDSAQTVDSLNIRDAVIGNGLMLSQGRKALTIHSVVAGEAELIGTYKSAGDALAALDALDDEYDF